MESYEYWNSSQKYNTDKQPPMNADTIPNLSPNPGQIPWDYLRSSALPNCF
jgi:hypothetical protein